MREDNQTQICRKIWNEAKKIESQLIEFRRDLHRNPELSSQESRTAALIAERLASLDFRVQTGVGGYGIVAELAGSAEGPTIALRADMDALPIQEETNLPYASQVTGVMHACGHDVHTAVLLGAATILNRFRAHIKGTVRFIFQPAEETLTGAERMIQEGVLLGVDEIYGLHNLPTLAAGRFAAKSGAFMAAIDRIEMRIQGKGGHGSMPDQCIDPIVASAAIIMGIQTAVSREIAPIEPAVVSIGSIHGGTANNVIPDTVELTGTVRTFSSEARRQMPGRLQRIAEQIAGGYRCDVEMRYISQVPGVVNHDACKENVRRAVELLFDEGHYSEALPTMGGEDFSLYLERVPGCFFWLGSGNADGSGVLHGLHSSKYTVDEACIGYGAALFAALMADRLGMNDQNLL